MKSDSDYIYWLERWSGWILIGFFTLIPVVRWAMLEPVAVRFGSFNSTLLTFGRLAGLVGFMLYAINLVLSIRRRWLENLFGGLNRVYIAHHLTGGLALVFLLFHPVFLAFRYIELQTLATIKDAASFLLPRAIHFDASYYEVQDAIAINNGIIAFLGMVVLLFITFFVKLPYRIWVFTHKFLGVAFVFAGLHTIMIVSDVYHDPFLKIYIIAWTIIGLAAYVYRSLLGNMFVRRLPYKVISCGVLPGNVVHVFLEPVHKGIDFKPGQFVFVRFLWSESDNITQEAHPFSIASSPNEPNSQLRLYMKALGDFTASLKNLKPGTIAEIEGAFGRFLPARYDNAPQIWIAGGIGITPFLSIARSFNQNKPQVDMFYSVQTRSELIDQEALADFLPKNYPQFKYHPFVSEEQNGFLTAEYINSEAGGVKGKEIFLCGPPPMMKSIRAQLKSMGVPNSKIHSEEFSMS